MMALACSLSLVLYLEVEVAQEPVVEIGLMDITCSIEL